MHHVQLGTASVMSGEGGAGVAAHLGGLPQTSPNAPQHQGVAAHLGVALRRPMTSQNVAAL